MRWGAMCAAAVLLLGAGCRARFTSERSGGEQAALDVSGADLGAGTLLGEAAWKGRAGHFAAGHAQLWSYAGGLVEVRFQPDFFCSDVPGPVVVLTPRDALGTALDPLAGDVELATLRATAGGQSYFVAGATAAEREVFVFCKPYGLEVARASFSDGAR